MNSTLCIYILDMIGVRAYQQGGKKNQTDTYFHMHYKLYNLIYSQSRERSGVV